MPPRTAWSPAQEVAIDGCRHSGTIRLSVVVGYPGATLSDSDLEEAQAALLDAKVQVKERVALVRYRAFVGRVSRLVGLDVSQKHDLTSFQLDTMLQRLKEFQMKDEDDERDDEGEAPVATQHRPPRAGAARSDADQEVGKLVTIPSAYETAKRAMGEGVKRAAVAGLVALVQPPALRLVAKGLGPEASKRAAKWLRTPTGEAAFSVIVGGVGLGAQALGLSGKFTAKLNAVCAEAVAQGIQGGAKTALVGALGELLAAYTQAAAQFDVDTAPVP